MSRRRTGRRVFVLGAYTPSGGAFMNYHLGRILERDFGVPSIAVMNRRWDNEVPGIFEYDLTMPIVSHDEFEQMITDEDFLIVGPSRSQRLYGWRLPGFKICYVQDFSTFRLLDQRLDHYVAVSDFVASFLRTTYGITPTVIPPFITIEGPRTVPAWLERPKTLVQPYTRKFPNIGKLSLLRLREILACRSPQVTMSKPIDGRLLMPHRNLLSRLGSSRYLLTLSPAEGFGLVALEAMALRTVVVGYDGFGGRHYMRPGVNCAVAPFPEIERVADFLIDLMESEDRGSLMAMRAYQTASQFTYMAFRNAWLGEFKNIFERAGV
jgi:Glycosyl transferases group 1